MSLDLTIDIRTATRSSLDTSVTRPTRAARATVDLEIVVPVYNEEERLPGTLRRLVPYLGSRSWTSRIIVVDNGSVDATAEVVDRAEALGVDVEVTGCRRRGKGAAVRAGIAQTTARWVAYCDADLSTPLESIDEGVHQLTRGFDVVLASRRCTGARYMVEQPKARRVASRLFQLTTRTLVGSVADTQCGLKLFVGDTARRLFTDCELSGFTFDVEVVARARRAGLRIIEIPVDWSHCEGSTLRLGRESLHVAREVVAVYRCMHQARVEPDLAELGRPALLGSTDVRPADVRPADVRPAANVRPAADVRPADDILGVAEGVTVFDQIGRRTGEGQTGSSDLRANAVP